jgi:hypothetical protein
MAKQETPKMISPTDKPVGLEEQVAKGLDELFKTDKFLLFSDLDDEEILNITLLMTWADTLGIQTITDFCRNFLQLRVSRFRLGRREVVSIASYSAEPERRKMKSLKDLFAGMR